MRDIGGATKGRHAPFGAIGDAVLFCVHGGLLVSLPNNGDVLTSRQKPIVALAHNAIILHQKTANLEAFAGAAGGGDLDNLFEVFVPGGALDTGSHWNLYEHRS